MQGLRNALEAILTVKNSISQKKNGCNSIFPKYVKFPALFAETVSQNIAGNLQTDCNDEND